MVPLIYVLTEEPRFAELPVPARLAFAGTVVFAAALALFYRIHRELGRSWSVTLEIRDQHVLVTDALYRHLRHPMYSAFWLSGAGAGTVAAKLDRGTGRAGRLWHAVLLPGRGRGAHDAGSVSVRTTGPTWRAPSGSFREFD